MGQEQTFIRVFGERNTGTRALLLMLEAQKTVITRQVAVRKIYDRPENAGLRAQISQSFDLPWRRIYSDAIRDMEHTDLCPTQMWKHTAIRWDTVFAAKKAHVVFAVRNPYSWFISLAKNPYHIFGLRPETLAAFATQPWMTQLRDNLAPVLPSPMALWQQKNTAYQAFQARAEVPVTVIRFEDFVADTVGEITRVLDGFGVAHENIRDIAGSTKEDGQSLQEITAFYAREGWKSRLTSGLVQIINEQIDWDLAAKYGYTPLSPVDFPDRLSKETINEIRVEMGFKPLP